MASFCVSDLLMSPLAYLSTPSFLGRPARERFALSFAALLLFAAFAML
jgi:hypothetical protein